MEVPSYLMGIVLISTLLISAEKQVALNPEFKPFGMPIKQIRAIAYLSLGAFVILIIVEIFSLS